VVEGKFPVKVGANKRGKWRPWGGVKRCGVTRKKCGAPKLVGGGKAQKNQLKEQGKKGEGARLFEDEPNSGCCVKTLGGLGYNIRTVMKLQRGKIREGTREGSAKRNNQFLSEKKMGCETEAERGGDKRNLEEPKHLMRLSGVRIKTGTVAGLGEKLKKKQKKISESGRPQRRFLRKWEKQEMT